MKETITIKFLTEKNFKHLRIIRLHGKEYNKYTAFIFYLRDFEYESIDALDSAILESLNQNQIAHLELNTKILFENQLEEIIGRFRLEETKDFTIQLSPIATDDLIKQMQFGRKVYSYLKYLKVSFLKGYNFMHFHNYYLAYLNIDELEKLESTITVI